MKSVTLYTDRDGNKYWLGQITYTNDGMLSGVTDFGNFSHAWRAFGDDFEDFLLDISPDYLAGKLESDLLYFGMTTRKAQAVSDRLARIILPPLKEAILQSRKEALSPQEMEKEHREMAQVLSEVAPHRLPSRLQETSA